MAGQQVSAAGIPWYRREDYDRILRIMADADKLPRTYDQWLQQAERVERRCKASGMIVVRAIVDPDEFPRWCASRGLNVDAKARVAWGNHAALISTKTTH